jgi:hypothetical protein
MKLRKRQKRKTAQALDAAAGITKIWSEWQIGKRATKTAAKSAAKVKKSGLKDKLTSKPARLAGLAALVGGAGAAIAKKLKGGGREPIYTPPGEGEPVAPPDVAPPLAIAPEPATPTDSTMPQGQREPAVGAAGLADDAGSSASPARPKPTAGDIEPAVPTDDPLPEPETPEAKPEPIADPRGAGSTPDDDAPAASPPAASASDGDEPAVEADELRPDSAAVAEDD